VNLSVLATPDRNTIIPVTMSDVFLAQQENVEDYVRAIQPFDRQVGVIFAIDGHPCGLDLFDSARTFATLLPRGAAGLRPRCS
jgi:hypothetical protein